MTFYLNRDGQSTPFELEQLRTMAQTGAFKQDEYVFDRRREEWLFPNQIDELKEFWTIGEEDKTVAIQLPADFVAQLAARQKAAVAAPEVHQIAAKAVALTPYSAPRAPIQPPEPSSPHSGTPQVIQPRFTGQGGDLLVTMLVGYLLSIVTLGIYLPWFLCNFQRLFLAKLAILEDGNTAGSFSFAGTGGELIGQFLLGILLLIVTFGIYAAWFQVSLMQFFARHTTVTLGAQSWRGRFSGTGGELLVMNLVGYLLTVVTLGIYGAWWLVKQLTFQTDHHHFDPQP